MAEIQGKNSFISGGSRGINAATPLKLAEQGANVAITYSKSIAQADNIIVQKIEAKGVKALAIQADAIIILAKFLQLLELIEAIQNSVSFFLDQTDILALLCITSYFLLFSCWLMDTCL